jgi:hypothetical protein
MTAETAEPGTATTGNATVTGRLAPAEWRVKRKLAGFAIQTVEGTGGGALRS